MRTLVNQKCKYFVSFLSDYNETCIKIFLKKRNVNKDKICLPGAEDDGVTEVGRGEVGED